MYLVVEYVLKNPDRLLLRVPIHKDYHRELHWAESEDEMRSLIRGIAEKNELDLQNEEELSELDGLIDVVVYTDVKVPSDYYGE